MNIINEVNIDELQGYDLNLDRAYVDVELRFNGVVGIGTFFCIISPCPIENKIRGDIPLLNIDIPLIVMTRPQISTSMPVYKDIGEQNSFGFVLIDRRININRFSTIQT